MEEFVAAELDVVQDPAKQPGREVLTAVDGHDRRPAIRMAKIQVATSLPKTLKTESFEDSHQLKRLEDGELTHAGTLTCCTPTNRRGRTPLPSISRQS